MYSGPAGFYKAPVAKVCLGLTALASVLSLTSPLLRHHWTLSYQALFLDKQLWRLIPASIAFHSLPELIFGAILLYFFRLFERQFGSSRYAVFVLFSHWGSVLFETLLLFAAGPHSGNSDALIDEPHPPASSPLPLTWSTPACGPYGLIFASFVLYAMDVPATARFTFFQHLTFTDKTLLYVAGLQLLLSSWSHSVIPGLCGVLMGCLFQANFCGIRKSQIPAPLAAAASHYLAFIQSQPPPPQQSGRGTTARAGLGAAALGTANGVPQGQRGPPNFGTRGGQVGGSAFYGGNVGLPSQESVEQLLAMGFDRDSALRALAQARNDLTVATNLLLESQHLG